LGSQANDVTLAPTAYESQLDLQTGARRVVDDLENKNIVSSVIQPDHAKPLQIKGFSSSQK